MSERLLRFARNDNVQCTSKRRSLSLRGLFRSNLPTFIKEIWLRLCCAMPFSDRRISSLPVSRNLRETGGIKVAEDLI
ncbi:MAG: hypothetical protein B6D35_11915 [Candidatus Brocadia sp. UTAMX2]|jgi:hypothetical protein|nr:MAG: hypothetical protein B6D35_11915 [Candidatus Brocadia sp. UTAMX2]